MTQFVIRDEQERMQLLTLIGNRKCPMTVTIVNGGQRSIEQNRLQRLWHNEAADQLGDETAEDKRAWAKLCIGVPILRDESDSFREQYDRVFKVLPYTTKLDLMKEPFDFPVTRLMTSKQKSKFLNELQRHYLGQGVLLTDPERGAM